MSVYYICIIYAINVYDTETISFVMKSLQL